MTQDQFAALAQLLRLRPGPSFECAKAHFVDGQPLADAAREYGLPYHKGWDACKRVADGFELVKIAAGNPS